MAASSSKAVITALFGNFIIATFKYFAAWMAGSSSMLAEGHHSLADTTNQCRRKPMVKSVVDVRTMVIGAVAQLERHRRHRASHRRDRSRCALLPRGGEPRRSAAQPHAGDG